MNRVTRELFGHFPRAVGVTTPSSDADLRQYLVHSEREFEEVVNKVEGRRNLYASISSYVPAHNGSFKGCAVRADKVSFDFDSSAKAHPDAEPDWSHPVIPDHADDYSIVEKMKESYDVRDAVLGDVCRDVRKLAQECMDREIPILGVFSGFGIHVHQLREPTKSRPGDKMLSTANKWVEELGLTCVDERASGRPFRIMRVPNIERVDHFTVEDGSHETTPTNIFTVPLTAEEMADIDPDELVDMSRTPRLEVSTPTVGRKELKVQEDHLGPGYEDGVGQEKMRPIPDADNVDEFAEVIVKEVVKMPCVYERALGRNPPNDVRVKMGIMFLNAGYSVRETTNVIAQLNWVDFDRDVTRYQLKQLKKSGKGDWSCSTMAGKGLCVRADDMESCPTVGYQGGNSPWQT